MTALQAEAQDRVQFRENRGRGGTRCSRSSAELAGAEAVKRRPGLFYGHWRDPVTGRQLRRATRKEIGEAYRLWAKHSDIRSGRRRAA